jgi:hypothetical protein
MACCCTGHFPAELLKHRLETGFPIKRVNNAINMCRQTVVAKPKSARTVTRTAGVRPLYGQAPTGAERMKRLRQKSRLRSSARAENICFVLLRLLHPVDLERYIAR